MPRCVWRPWMWAIALALMAGCADNTWTLKGQVANLQTEQQNLVRQSQALQDRANGLNQSNQELTTLLAQARQETKVVQERLAATNEQLRGATAQLAKVSAEKQDVDQKARTLTTSMQRQGSVAITPNNSFLQTMPVINQPDVYVRRDGDVIRVELPGTRLFESGGATLRPGAANLIADAANELQRTYPDQIIGIEGHTDSDPVIGGQWRNNHQLSTARAMAVYDILVSGARFRADQLFVVGHGSNHPAVSNATPEGKQRNRRVELVVYPEKTAVPQSGPFRRGN